MKKVLSMIVAACLIFVGCSEARVSEQTIEENVNVETEQVKFQDIHSMDWDAEDENILLWVADCTGGTEYDRAWNILVTLNRVWSEEYPGSIQDVAEQEFGEYWAPDCHDTESLEAIRLVTIERWDETNGSFEYLKGEGMNDISPEEMASLLRSIKETFDKWFETDNDSFQLLEEAAEMIESMDTRIKLLTDANDKLKRELERTEDDGK